MANPFNSGNLIGRLVRDLHVSQNSDGSHTVLGTVAVDANYKNRENETITDFVPFSSYVGARVNGLGAWANVGKGDLIALSVTIQSRPYEKNGEMVYPEPKIVAEGFPQYLESRAVTTQRRAEQAKAASAATPAAAAVPAAAAPTAADDKDAEIERLRAQLAGGQTQQAYSIENQF